MYDANQDIRCMEPWKSLYVQCVWCKTAIPVVEGKGVLGLETDVIWGSDDETPGLSGRIFQLGRADGERVWQSAIEFRASSDRNSDDSCQVYWLLLQARLCQPGSSLGIARMYRVIDG